VFVPEDRALRLFGGTPPRPDPLFKLPVRFAAYGLSAVPLGVALSTIDALKDLAKSKKSQPLQPPMAHRPSVHHTIGKAEAMVEAALLAARAIAGRGLRELYEDGAITLESRARLHGALVHAVETSIEAVSMCHREAGGSAVYQSNPFERALRDVHVVGGHGVFQRSMMEDVGRVALGLGSQLGI
jgi:alkylation response protein AidB-like acyl-CoA dehydrogenase